MKKANLLILCLVLGLGLAFSGSAQAACGDTGCTPGYWKQEQHFDSWVKYSTDDNFNAIFGVGPSITLLEALWARGGGENALLRHAVAALLNAAATEAGMMEYWWKDYSIISKVVNAYGSGDFESAKDELANENEKGCPLD